MLHAACMMATNHNHTTLTINTYTQNNARHKKRELYPTTSHLRSGLDLPAVRPSAGGRTSFRVFSLLYTPICNHRAPGDPSFGARAYANKVLGARVACVVMHSLPYVPGHATIGQYRARSATSGPLREAPAHQPAHRDQTVSLAAPCSLLPPS